MTPDAITFDFHNTIACCDDWFQLEVHDLLSAFLDWAAADEHIPTPTPLIFERSARLYHEIRHEVQQSGIEQDAHTCIQIILDALGIQLPSDTITTGLKSIFQARLAQARPLPGIIEAVEQLAATGISLAVISSAIYHPYLLWTLEEFRIAQHFQHIVTSACCGIYKSSPEIYRYTASLLEVEPSKCVHIGDSLRYDVQSAASAGMQTVFVDWSEFEREQNTADLVIATTAGLHDHLLEKFELRAYAI